METSALRFLHRRVIELRKQTYLKGAAVDGFLHHQDTDSHPCRRISSSFSSPSSFALPLFQVLYWLSGLTCTDENFIQKSGAQRDAAEKGVAIVACDTSPREYFCFSLSLRSGNGVYEVTLHKLIARPCVAK